MSGNVSIESTSRERSRGVLGPRTNETPLLVSPRRDSGQDTVSIGKKYIRENKEPSSKDQVSVF